MTKKKDIQQPSEYREAATLNKIAQTVNPAIIAPFGRDPKTGDDLYITVIARELSYVQVKACGDFSLIETFQDKIFKENKQPTMHEMVEYSELFHSIVKASLLSPTYDQIINTITKYDAIDDIDQQLKDIKAEFLELEKSSSDKDKIAALQEEYARLELQYKYVLPENFLVYMFNFALRVNSTDIKLVSEEMLYSAAIKANLGHNNPSDHLPGVFSEFNREDIDERAWSIFFEKKKEMEEQNKHKNGAK